MVLLISLVILILTSIITEKTLAQQIQQCPSTKSFPAKGSGEGVSPITTHNLLTGPIPILINTPEIAKREAMTESTTQCSSNLASNIAQATIACATYCMSVPDCVSQVSVNGPNTCSPNNAICQQKTVLGSSLGAKILRFIEQLINIPYTTIANSNVNIASCVNSESSSILCECNS